MQLKAWIKETERNGWRVVGVNSHELRIQCAKVGCAGSKSLPVDNLGEPPARCDLPHDGRHAKQVFTEYRILVEELRRRRRSLGMDQSDLNAAMGLADGYVNKLEAFHRLPSPPTLLLWCQALGVHMSITPTTLPPATLKAIEDRQARPYRESHAHFRHAVQLPLSLPAKDQDQ